MQVVISESVSFKAVPLKTTNGIFIEFAGALIPLTEGLFVCLLSACEQKQEPHSHTADWISSLSGSGQGKRENNTRTICLSIKPSSDL